MMKMFSIMIFMATLSIISSVFANEEDPYSQFLNIDRLGPDLSHSNVYVFVGKIERVEYDEPLPNRQVEFPTDFTYHVVVYDELRGRETSNSVKVTGLVGLQGSNVRQRSMPIFAKDSLIIIAAKPAGRMGSGQYRFAGAGVLPIGSVFPHEIEQVALAPFLESFVALREFLLEKPEEEKRSRLSESWLDSPNDYMWSLGLAVQYFWSDKRGRSQIRSNVKSMSLHAQRQQFTRKLFHWR